MIIEHNKINCETAFDMMFDYIDGTLEKSDLISFEYHIKSCEKCRQELAERREMLVLLKSAAHTAPSELRQSVMDKIENIPQESKASIIRRRIMKWAGPAVAACIALTVLVAYRGGLFDGAKFDVKSNDAEAARIAENDGNSEVLHDNAAGSMYYVKQYDADEKSDEAVYIETTISALDALAPGKYETEVFPDACGTLAKDEDDDIGSLFDKIQAREFPVVVVGRADINDSYFMDEPETVIIDGQVFLRYVVTSEAEPILDAIINELETNNTAYKVASPEKTAVSNTVELLVFDDSEN